MTLPGAGTRKEEKKKPQHTPVFRVRGIVGPRVAVHLRVHVHAVINNVSACRKTVDALRLVRVGAGACKGWALVIMESTCTPPSVSMCAIVKRQAMRDGTHLIQRTGRHHIRTVVGVIGLEQARSPNPM